MLACGNAETEPDIGGPSTDVGTLPDLGQDPDSSAVPDLQFDLSGDPDALDTTSDETPPALSFTSPADGSRVTGEVVQVTLIATDPSGIASVELWLNNEALGAQTDEPFEFLIDGATLPSGDHALRAVARDGADNTSEAVIEFSFEQPCSDPPCSPVEIRWLSPRDVDTVCRGVRLEVLLIPAEVVESVEYQLDGATLGTASTPPWTYEWETRDSPDGTYVLSATTTRADGRQATLDREIIVANRGQDCALPPSVGFVSPEAGSVIRDAVSVVLALSESATGVSLFVDGSFAADLDVASPTVEIETSGFPEGQVDLRALATDARGRSAEAESSVTIDRTAPTLTVFSPFGGTYDGTVLLAADVFDAGGIREVLWYDAATTTASESAGEVTVEGAGPIADGGTDGRAELDLNIGEWESGRHEVIAVATDRAGWSAMDTASFIVDRPPVVELLSPAAGDDVQGPTTLSVHVRDDAGPVSLVLSNRGTELWTGEVGERAVVDETAEVPWEPEFIEGAQALQLDAFDRFDGAATISFEFPVNHPPRIDVLLCQAGCVSAAEVDEVSGVVGLEATAIDDGGEVVSVELSVDGETVQTDSSAPFEFDWDSAAVPNGPREVRLRALTDDGEEGTWSRTYEVAN